MAPGAVTHANDMSQRHVPLAVTASGGGTLTVHAPASAALAPPTYYMLFVLNDSGVPSVAKFIRLKLGRENPPPDTLINSGPAPESQSASATFEFDSTPPGSTFECRRDGGAPAPCVSPWSYSGLSDGSHSFEVTAIDVHGKADPTPAVRSWTVQTSSTDYVPPETSIVSSPPLSTASPSATFRFSSSEERLELRVPARRGRLDRLLGSDHLSGAPGGPSHLRRARHRCRRQHRSEPGLVGMGGDEPGCSGVRDRELSRYRHGQHGYGRYERCGFDAASARRVCAAGGDAQANSRRGCLSDGALRSHRGGTDPDRRSGALPQPEAGVRSAAARCQDETRASRLEERLEDGAASVAEAKADQGESRADRPGFRRQRTTRRSTIRLRG